MARKINCWVCFSLCFCLSTHRPGLGAGEGGSLLSGGRESVLVEWRDAAEKTKEFLPRLGATIEHISVSPAGDLLCTSHSDNSTSIRTHAVCAGPQLPAACKEGQMEDLRLAQSSLTSKEHFFLPFFLFCRPLPPEMPPPSSIFRVVASCGLSVFGFCCAT